MDGIEWRYGLKLQSDCLFITVAMKIEQQTTLGFYCLCTCGLLLSLRGHQGTVSANNWVPAGSVYVQGKHCDEGQGLIWEWQTNETEKGRTQWPLSFFLSFLQPQQTHLWPIGDAWVQHSNVLKANMNDFDVTIGAGALRHAWTRPASSPTALWAWSRTQSPLCQAQIAPLKHTDSEWGREGVSEI